MAESLLPVAASVSTPSTKHRVMIFRTVIPSILSRTEMSPQVASSLVDITFNTLAIYDDGGSKKAVDDLISKGLVETTFMKTFASTLVQIMEKQAKLQSHVGCLRLLKWSCLLLTRSQFATLSKNAVCRLAAAHASIVHIVMQRSFGERRACQRMFFHLFSQLPDIYKTYVQELKDARIPYKDTPELMWLLLEFSSASSIYFKQSKPIFLDIYVKTVLNAREKPINGFSECFHPLFTHMSHEDLQNIVVPLSVKMLKRNPEIVLESVAILLESVNLDLSKYATELLSVVLSQARHADEARRVGALAIVRCLGLKSSNPDTVEAMSDAVKAILRGSEGRLQFPYQRIGMFNAVQELSCVPEGKHINSMSCSICGFLLSCYKDEGNEEVKLAILSGISSWAARSVDAIQPDLVSFIASGFKEKEILRRAHLRCLRAICKNADAVLQISSLLGPLVQLVKTGFTKAVQRLDGVYALLVVGKIASADMKAEETLAKEKIWSLISQNEPSLVQISTASKFSIVDCMACIDLLEVLLVEHSCRVVEAFSVDLLLQLLIFLLCHPSWDVRKMSQEATRKIIAAAPQLSQALLLEFTHFLSGVAEKYSILKVKSAILSTLTVIISKGGMSLKPFLPQLQTTFIKCLQDNTRTVRTSAALALGKLSALSTRVDPLVSDLLSSLQTSDSGVREAILTALKGVLKHAGKSVSGAVRIRVYTQLQDLIHHDDDQVRIYAASILGIISKYMEDAQLADLLQLLSTSVSSQIWVSRRGSVLTVSSLLQHNPSSVVASSAFSSILDCLNGALRDEKFPLRETSTKALGRLLLHQIQSDPSNTIVCGDIISTLVSSLRDDSSEVRRRALSALKAVAKASPLHIVAHVSIVGPALAECLKDSSTPVRLAAERCTLHAFQLTKGVENVQASQKFITGLDARRLSKFPEYSDDSEGSEDDLTSS